ncbi:hypothetical protein PLICRDRAFT_124713 [Plicaturopsis crispa FD-325 SS-3]|nr:hypothetical protein PLICRDRAFT_124713 [Plicaturopsis crispa FD-325 SS-3]
MAEEYTVESILKARVDRIDKRGKKVHWKYLVKWKGFDAEEDNTWEPPKSFEDGSEHLLEKFWDVANTGGHDRNDPSLFKKGDEALIPVGPPRRRTKSQVKQDAPKETVDAPTASTSSAKPDKKRPASPEISAEPSASSAKRKRGPSNKAKESEASASASKAPRPDKRRRVSSTTTRKGKKAADQPPVEDNEDPLVLLGSPAKDEVFMMETEETNDPSPSQETSTAVESNGNATAQTSVTPPSKPKAPTHRERAANPRVKMLDDDNFSRGMQSAIPTKARLLGLKASPAPFEADNFAAGPSTQGASPTIPPPRPVRSKGKNKPGPGRSSSGAQKASLLTFENGNLTTKKGASKAEANHAENKMDVDLGDTDAEGEIVDEETIASMVSVVETSEPAPSGAELLAIAGLDAKDAEALPDFEEDSVQEQEQPRSQSTSIFGMASQTITAAKNTLFPPASAFGAPEKASSTMWSRSTIFGPLGLGSDVPSTSAPEATSTSTSALPAFSLSLTSSVAVPVSLKDIQPATTSPDLLPLDTIVARSPKGPPGKIYTEQCALAMIGALRTGGSSARVVLNTDDEKLKAHFERFSARLQAGDMFVAVAGGNVLAFSASENRAIGQRLGIPPVLLGLAGTVLVSCVAIEDVSAYAEAAMQADDIRW